MVAVPQSQTHPCSQSVSDCVIAERVFILVGIDSNVRFNPFKSKNSYCYLSKSEYKFWLIEHYRNDRSEFHSEAVEIE